MLQGVRQNVLQWWTLDIRNQKEKGAKSKSVVLAVDVVLPDRPFKKYQLSFKFCIPFSRANRVIVIVVLIPMCLLSQVHFLSFSSSNLTSAMSSAAAIWEIPEVLLYQIISFAAGPTHRARVVCHQLSPLCHRAHSTLSLETHAIWDAILTTDYGVTDGNHSTKRKRVSSRLQQSHLQRVRDAHLMIKDNTEIAYFYLTEMCMTSSKKACLSRARLTSLLDEYGPHLRLNHLVSSGGSFLVEVCRARHVTEKVILKCVEEFMERRNTNVNLVTNEPGQLTALCVAAARGMHHVVTYLVDKQRADHTIPCSGRFRLNTKPKRTVLCTNAIPLQFAMKMLTEEKAAGAHDSDLRSLKSCIQQLHAKL